MTRQRDERGRFVTSPTSIVKVTDKRSITASVSDVPEERIAAFRSSSEGKGMRAWKLWRILGVLHYPTSFMAEQVMRLDWDVSVDGRELEPEQAAEAVAAVTSPEGTREIARRLALNLEVAGEVYYIRKQDEWATVSAAAPKLKERLEGADIAIRGWLADPVEPEMADSPVFSALDVAEELRVMAALSRSQTRNRLAQRGILLRPKEWTFPDGDDFTARFRETTTAPIADEYSAAAVTPLDIAGPAEYIDKWKHLVLDFPYDDKLDQRIDNAIKRLALSLNMPPEVLLGNMTASHWNAWLSDEQTYRSHVQPLAYQVAQIFARAMTKAAPSSGLIVVTPDPSELLARRSSVADAFEAAKLGAVGLEYVRKAMGADEDDAPTPEDLAIILALLGHASAEPEMGIEQRPAAPAMPRSTPNGNGQPAIAAAVSEDEQALEELSRSLVALDQRLLGTLRGASALAVEQARERNDAEEIGVQGRIAEQMGRLGRAWRREIADAHDILRGLGIDATGPAWQEAADVSVDILIDGMTAYITDTIDRTDSDMPALPTPLLRRVLAAAGGSNTATVAAIGGPAPTFADPQGFAIGVLSLKDLKTKDIEIVQWRFRYGPLTRSVPFLPHKAVDGQFMTADGYTRGGWAPNDHKGCVLAGTTVEGPRASAATLRDYEGTIVDLTLSSGKFVSVTPNHPILTPKGWVPAGLLVEGGYVVGRFDAHGAAKLVPDDCEAPALIEDVVGALHETARMFTARVPVTAEHFHGDGEGSEVAVVTTDRLLGDGVDMTLSEPTSHQLLGGVESTRGLTPSGDADPLGFWLSLAALRFMGSGGPGLPLLGGREEVLGELGGRIATWLDACRKQARTDGSPRYGETLTQREFRLSGLVAADQVVKIERRDVSGHVYNLQTRPGWYVAGGVIVHNCECSMDPVFKRGSVSEGV